MIRSSEHILKFQTNSKTVWLSKLFSDYKLDLQFYIDLLWNNKLPLEKTLSSKKIPANIITHSQYKQILYKHASEIIRSNILKKKTSKPIIKNISINIDERLFNIQTSKHFNEFVHLRLPYFKNKARALFIRLPIKYHRHSLKFKDWKRASTIKLKECNKKYFVIFSYEKEEPEKRRRGKSIGIDQGYKKLIVTSEGKFVGREFELLYERIAIKEQGSRNFKQLLVERDKKINEVINQMDLSRVRKIVIEDLKGIKKNSKGKIYKKFNNKLQRWCYTKVVSKLERLCEENGILLMKVSPTYTSQTCFRCRSIHNESRDGERYKCIDCGYEVDADLNAARNILVRGVYNPSTAKT